MWLLTCKEVYERVLRESKLCEFLVNFANIYLVCTAFFQLQPTQHNSQSLETTTCKLGVVQDILIMEEVMLVSWIPTQRTSLLSLKQWLVVICGSSVLLCKLVLDWKILDVIVSFCFYYLNNSFVWINHASNDTFSKSTRHGLVFYCYCCNTAKSCLPH